MNWAKRLWWLTVPAMTIASGIGWGWDGLHWVPIVYIPLVVVVETILYIQRKQENDTN